MAITSLYGSKKNNAYYITKTDLVDPNGELTYLDVSTDSTNPESAANVDYVTQATNKNRSKSFVYAICDLSIYQFSSLQQNTSFIFDGIAIPINQRILCINDVSGANNGIWEVIDTNGTFSLIRPKDYCTVQDVIGAEIFVYHGNTYSNSLWVSTCEDTDLTEILGVAPITCTFLISPSNVIVSENTLTNTVKEMVNSHKEVIVPGIHPTSITLPSTVKIQRITLIPNSVHGVFDFSIQSATKTYVNTFEFDVSYNTTFVYEIYDNTESGSLSYTISDNTLFTSGSITMFIEYLN